MKFISTRNKNEKVSAAEAIVYGLAKDGGLFVPEEFPSLSHDEILKMTEMSYEERAASVLSKFMDDFTYEELLGFAEKAYSRFYGDSCPLVQLEDDTYLLELWHGPTCAFKDMALTLLPHLLTASRAKIGEKNKTLIMVATSGDTGKAALEGFKDVENTKIIVFYPSEGVSDMQKLQMMTQEGDNVFVSAIKGNFDDAQSAVKEVFGNKAANKQLLDKGYVLSSANSINWGRLAPQIAYYISAYVDLVDAKRINVGDKVSFVVPSGNFGNILAGYYAKRMGLPIDKLCCASNVNNVLTDFFTTGVYDTNREFYKTTSPSMDILISSNLERLLFEISGRDDKAVAKMMNALKSEGKYTVDKSIIDKCIPEFMAGFADEDEVQDTIRYYYDEFGYLLDPHTGVACAVREMKDFDTPVIVVSTASPYKFPSDVYSAIDGEYIESADKAALELNEETGEEIPEPLKNLKGKPIRFNGIIEKVNILNEVLSAVENE